MKKLLFSGNTAWGMYNFRGVLLKHFVDEGYDVTVSAPYDEKNFKLLEELGCKVVDVPINPKGVNPFTEIGLIARYRNLMKKIRPDASITYTIKPNIYATLAAESLRIPFLPVTTGLGYVFLSKGFASFMAKALYWVAFRKARRVWFLNRDDVKTFRDQHLIKPEKVEQLPGEGVDLGRFQPMPVKKDDKIRFLLVGRILVDKGVVEFVDAAKELKRKYPNAVFQLLGALWPGNPAAISEGKLDEWVKAGVIEYLGRIDDVRPVVAASDCVVLPSYREGVPCTLMEAAAMEKPLVATDVPGCHEVVKDGYNGYLCQVKNSAALADAMERVIQMSQSEREQMGKNGRKLMLDKFDVKLIIKQYDEALKDLFG